MTHDQIKRPGEEQPKIAKSPYKFYEIVWDDATSNSESWVHLNDIDEVERVITRGWLVKETDRALTIANSISAQEDKMDTVGNVMTIPRGMIITQREIKVTSARPKKVKSDVPVA